MNRTGRDLLRAALARHADSGGALVGEAVGVHGVTAGFAPSASLVRTPLSEGAALGVAAGLALAGRAVIVELVDPAGLARAADVLADLA
jgi:pyruvate/2-oxoglutarate/acetoin dehydrogenase E1 component